MKKIIEVECQTWGKIFGSKNHKHADNVAWGDWADMLNDDAKGG